MPFDLVNIGATADDGTGDPLRTAFSKLNTNFGLAVEGATGATDGNLVVFDGPSGKLVKDTGISFSSLAAGLTFLGVWNASTNSPALASSVGVNGTYYIVGTAGSTTLNGLTSWLVGDYVIFTGGVWVRYRPGATLLAGDGTAGAPGFAFAADTDVGLFRPAANTLAFSTGGTERVRITNTELDVTGDLFLSGTQRYGGSNGINVVADTTATSAGLTVLNLSHIGNSRPRFFVNNPNTAGLRQGAYVRVGDNQSSHIITLGAGGTPSNTLTAGPFIDTSNHPLLVAVNGTERMRITSAGNVGIGTTSPEEKLQVEGAVTLSGGRTSYLTSETSSAAIYRTNTTGGSYPFNGLGHLIIQPRLATTAGNQRDIVFVTGDSATPSHTMIIKRTQRVGLGVEDPTFKFELPNSASDAAGRGRANNWSTYSDGRIKTNRETLLYGLSAVMQLEPLRYFHHNSKQDDNGNVEILSDGAVSIGLVAQDVAQVIPEIVSVPEDLNKDLCSLDYAKLNVVLIKAVQELSAKVDALEAKLEEK